MGAKKHKKIRKEVRLIYGQAAEKQVETDLGVAFKMAQKELRLLRARVWTYRLALLLTASWAILVTLVNYKILN